MLNQKGGVGKTTIATNVAAAAHLAKKRTLVIDQDPQASAFEWYASRRSEGSDLDGLVVVRADKRLDHRKYKDISAGFDVVVCDGPPRISDVTQAAAVVADVTLIPLRPGRFDWWALKQTLQVLDVADGVRGSMGLRPSRRVFVVNGARHRAGGTAHMLHALTEGPEKVEIAPTIISREAFVRASTNGESVLTNEPESAAAEQIRALWSILTSNGGAYAQAS